MYSHSSSYAALAPSTHRGSGCTFLTSSARSMTPHKRSLRRSRFLTMARKARSASASDCGGGEGRHSRSTRTFARRVVRYARIGKSSGVLRAGWPNRPVGATDEGEAVKSDDGVSNACSRTLSVGGCCALAAACSRLLAELVKPHEHAGAIRVALDVAEATGREVGGGPTRRVAARRRADRSILWGQYPSVTTSCAACSGSEECEGRAVAVAVVGSGSGPHSGSCSSETEGRTL